MPNDIDDRIGRLLDQLESPFLTDDQISKIRAKLRILEEQKKDQVDD